MEKDTSAVSLTDAKKQKRLVKKELLDNKHSSENSGITLTQRCENMVDDDIRTANMCSQPDDEEEADIKNMKTYGTENFSHKNDSEEKNDLQLSKNIGVCNFPEKYDEAKNPFTLQKEPAAVSKSIVVKYPHLALIVIGEYMRLVWQKRHIFPDHKINATVMGMKSWIFRMKSWIFRMKSWIFRTQSWIFQMNPGIFHTACFVTFEILLSFIFAQFCSRYMVRTCFLNTRMIQFLCQLSLELLAIGASKDTNEKVCCIYCAKKVSVKNVADLKKGQHLTRPGQSKDSSHILYEHHMLVEDIEILSNETVRLTLIHMTKVKEHIGLYKTKQKIFVPNQNLNSIEYKNPKYSPEEIIDCANFWIAKLECYNLFSNNCETVIRGLVLGIKISLQVYNSFEIIANILLFIFWITWMLMSWCIELFTIVAIVFYVILIILARVLSKRCQKNNIICASHLIYIRNKIISYLLAIGWLTYEFII